jgi:hypothetical protein
MMCRKLLECICDDKGIPGGPGIPLAKRLPQLKDKEFIDRKLLEWSWKLSQLGNLAAHDGSHETTKEDAENLWQFADAICEYIYRLDQKYRAFLARCGRKSGE